MKSVRVERINSEIQKVLSNIIAYEVRDPQIDAMISVSSVETTPDLSQCRVFITSIGKTEPEEVLNRIKGAAGFIRGRLSKAIKLRITPRLEFMMDNSQTYASKIDEILKGIKYSTEVDEEDE